MIPEEKIETHLKTAKETVAELYSELENKVNAISDLILFLENGHKTNRPVPGTLPFVIGPGEEYHDDKYRVEFYTQYLQSAGKNKHEQLVEEGKIDDIKPFQRFSLFLELMIYSHLWENRKNLRELKQISLLLEGNSYSWEIEVPEYGKSQFIDDEIKGTFKKHNLKAGTLFDSIYISQIRNAFAHSQFSFMPNGAAINLGNYDGSEFKNLKQIKIEDWEDIFLKSTLFFHEFLIKKANRRIELGQNNPEVEIEIPVDENQTKKVKIYWHDYGKAYSFNKPAS